MFLKTVFVVICVLCSTVHSAFAEWSYTLLKDEFDGKITKRIMSNSDGLDAFAVFSDRSGVINAKKPSIVLKPNSAYICATSERERIFVSWIVYNESGSVVSEDFLTDWETSSDHKSIFINNSRARDSNLTQGEKLLSALTEGNEVRFRFTDDCGNKSTIIFSLEGFSGVYKKIQQ